MRNKLFEDVQAIYAKHETPYGYNNHAADDEKVAAIIRRRRIRSTHPADLPYVDFLDCPYWLSLAEWMKDRACRCCQICGEQKLKSSDLHVHHKTYKHRGQECPDHLDDLIVLCAWCHRKIHGKLEGYE